MGRIIAIGGGELSELETLPIDTYIVKQINKQKPRALFIPTASGEPEGYISTFNKVYGEKLGCITDTLCLISETLTDEEIREKILSADIIYVGGGDTGKMLSVWKSKKVDVYLKEAFQKDIILSGLSAGSICWFKYGHSEISVDPYDFIQIEGLGFIDAIHCPHYNEEERKVDFDKMIGTLNITGIAVEDNCAIEFNRNQYRIIKAKESANAYIFQQENGEIKKTVIPYSDLFQNFEL
ncbi:MAG TPA: peptidase E [Pseudoneobacillus sp.]|nr:peptidase E [Pseudoneobacillus sp.]